MAAWCCDCMWLRWRRVSLPSSQGRATECSIMKKQTLAHLSTLCLVAGVSLGAWATLHMLRDAQSTGGSATLEVCWPPADLGELRSGSHRLIVQVTNPGPVCRRILGMMSGCRNNVCYEPVAPQPIPVAASATVGYEVELTVSGSGPFEVPLVIFVDDEGVRKVNTTLRGIAIEARGTNNAPNPIQEK
jgi:hypothetical protein